MTTLRTRDELLDARLALDPDAAVGAVLTMGSLHEGHLALVEQARRDVGPDGTVILTVFVNPLQFGANEDLSRYPRDLDADVAAARGAGADIVFAPEVDEVYPDGPATITVDPGPLGTVLEGAARPTHFRGVLTVVAKLLNLIVPSVSVFGEKDYQQLVLIRRMCRELELGVQITGCGIVREPDGLALSSRNVYLTPEQRQQGLALSQALDAGRSAAVDGADAALGAARAVLDAADGVELDYLVVTDPELGDAPTSGPARLLVASTVGSTRLLDNSALLLGSA